MVFRSKGRFWVFKLSHFFLIRRLGIPYGDYSVCGHLFRGTSPHITAQIDHLISLKSDQLAHFKRFSAPGEVLRTDRSFF